MFYPFSIHVSSWLDLKTDTEGVQPYQSLFLGPAIKITPTVAYAAGDNKSMVSATGFEPVTQ